MDFSFLPKTIVVYKKTEGLELLRSHKKISRPFYLLKDKNERYVIFPDDEEFSLAISDNETAQVRVQSFDESIALIKSLVGLHEGQKEEAS